MRCTIRSRCFHRTIAEFQHINHQVETGDDVMSSYHFLKEKGVPITFGPGRHPSSSARFLYFRGPDGMVFEYSSGVKSIADELLYRETAISVRSHGLHCANRNPILRLVHSQV